MVLGNLGRSSLRRDKNAMSVSGGVEDQGVRLMLALQAGDEAAFEELVVVYQDQVFGMFRRLLGPHAVVEDLAQEAFLRVWKARDRYQPTGKLSTWIYRITYNLALNRIRDDKRKPSQPLPRNADGGTLEIADLASVRPESAVEKEDWKIQIEAALAALPENQRAALVFQHYEGMDLQEIGDLLQISSKAAKSLLHRARENLRAKLGPLREKEQ